MIQIAEGIKLLNFEGYIHCDLKPENILVNQTENGNYIYKIIAFGSAFRLEEGLPKIVEILYNIDNHSIIYAS